MSKFNVIQEREKIQKTEKVSSQEEEPKRIEMDRNPSRISFQRIEKIARAEKIEDRWKQMRNRQKQC